jgi:CheY-like chemotaxis protein
MKPSKEILMVEDSATDAELASRALARAKVANPLIIIPTAEEALDYLFGIGTHAKHGATRPLLILLDLDLPKMSGVEFLREIKRDQRTLDIPVVTLSFTKSIPEIVTCIQLDVAGHLIKPVESKSLAGVMKRLKLSLTMLPPKAAEADSTRTRERAD